MFIVIEVQDNYNEATIASFQYTKQTDAFEKYFSILASASQSEIKYHSAAIFANGYLVKTDMVSHEAIGSFQDIEETPMDAPTIEPESIIPPEEEMVAGEELPQEEE